MKKLEDISQFANYLKDNKLLYLIDYKIVFYNEPAFDFEVFTYDNETFLLVQHMPYGIYASLVNYKLETFDTYLSFLRENYEHFSLSITLPQEAEVDIITKSNNSNIYKTLIGEYIGIKPNNIRKASKNDEKLIKTFEQETDENMIALKDAFNEYVINSADEGEIYLCVCDDIVGYLICVKEFENIWDVIYIYVKPEHRNKGYGKILAQYYNYNKNSQNQIPLYTGVSNIASEKAALNSGFKPYSNIVYLNY